MNKTDQMTHEQMREALRDKVCLCEDCIIGRLGRRVAERITERINSEMMWRYWVGTKRGGI